MHKIVIGGVTAAFISSAAFGTAVFAGGNGAQRSGLSPQSGSNSDQCVEGTGDASNGFVLVNAPGQPGQARFVNGEVSLKNDSPGGQTYTVWIKDVDNNTCVMDGMLTTNGQGNGNAHLATAGTSGHYYVVLQDSGMQEKYASQEVQAN